MNCIHCGEPLGVNFIPVNDGAAGLHQECAIRMSAGSVGHQRGRCHCYGGAEEDPPGLTVREAALAAAREYLLQCGMLAARGCE
jgi:hypothetical protein